MNPAIADQPFLFQPPAHSAAAEGASRDRAGNSNSETQREISAIVREIASVSRSDISGDRYFAKLADGILRAMAAAKGVVIWSRRDDRDYRVVARLGPHTDTSIPKDSCDSHVGLLEEVFQTESPVIVPPTPGANSPDAAVNPTEFPAAIVPLDIGVTDAEGFAATGTLIQVFLENGENVVAQRGYLRFIAQMADLSGDFLRSRRLRELTEDQRWTKQIDQWCDELSRLSSPASIAERIADLMVEAFGFDRAAYLRPTLSGRATYRVAAVSHVDQVDEKSDAVGWLVGQATQHAVVDCVGTESVWLDDRHDREDRDNSESGRHLRVAGVVTLGSTNRPHNDVVVLLRSGSAPRDLATRSHLERFLSVTKPMMARADSETGHRSRRFSAGANPYDSTAPSRVSRRWAFRCGLGVAVALIACLPVSMNMTADATLRPSHVQRVCAPRPAVVENVFVQHGDYVRTGDVLVELSDTDLNEQLVTLQGRRSVLMEKRGVWTETLVEPERRDSRGVDSMRVREDAQTQRQLTEAELRGVEEEIELLKRTKASLRIVADRDGYVDAWELQGDERQRPVRRGEPLLSVVDDQSSWYVDAMWTQSRVRHLYARETDGPRTATICPVSDPDLRFQGLVDLIGPSLQPESSAPRTNVRLVISSTTEAVADATILREGAPVRVLVNCGRQPLYYVLFQDAIDWVRLNASLYGASI